MKDVYTPKKVPRIEVREHLHGHTKIELYNVRTGRVERVEHHNTFTDGIESYMRDLGEFCNSPYQIDTVRNRTLWKTLVGGILLFDTALPTSPLPKYMPAGITMTANGSFGVSNSGNPVELGSYNSIESTEGSDSVTMVYDWGTSQGNGNIASVALTTQDGGYIGYGNPSGGSGSARTIYATQSCKQVGGSTWSTAWKIWNNKLYTVTNSQITSGTSSLSIAYKFINYKEIDIFSTTSASTTGNVSFTLPSALSGNYVIINDSIIYPSCVWLVPISNISNGSTYKIFKCDLSDGTVTSYNMTNNTGKTITGGFIWIVDTDAIVCVCTDGTYYKVQISTSNVIGQVTIIGSSDRTGQSRTSIGSSLTPELLTLDRKVGLYDRVLNRILPTNGYTANSYDAFNYVIDADAVSQGATSAMRMWKNPMRLMTVNNLDETLTKDSTKTMKVTYTVTRSA